MARRIIQAVLEPTLEPFDPSQRFLTFKFYDPERDPAGPGGPPGLTAYQVWLAAGNAGTVDDYLTSLQGPPGVGAKGDDGLSAYQVWLAAGNAGSVDDYLVSLQGDDGDDGLSAYQVWLAAGNSGTVDDYLAALKGADGDDGLSAYQVWLAAGNSGTVDDFLESLQGPPGTSTPSSSTMLVIARDGAASPTRGTLNFIGDGISVVDDAANDQTDVKVTRERDFVDNFNTDSRAQYEHLGAQPTYDQATGRLVGPMQFLLPAEIQPIDFLFIARIKFPTATANIARLYGGRQGTGNELYADVQTDGALAIYNYLNGAVTTPASTAGAYPGSGVVKFVTVRRSADRFISQIFATDPEVAGSVPERTTVLGPTIGNSGNGNGVMPLDKIMNPGRPGLLLHNNATWNLTELRCRW